MCGKHHLHAFGYDRLYPFGMLRRKRMRVLLAVIGKYPDVMVPSLGAVRSKVKIFDRAVEIL